MVKLLLAVSVALVLVLALASTAQAVAGRQGNGPMYGRTTTQMPTTYGRTTTQMPTTYSPSTSTTMGTSVTRGTTLQTSGVFYSPSRRAPVVPAGAVVMSQSVSGTMSTVTYRLGTTNYVVNYLPTGRYTYTTTRAMGTTSTFTPTTSTSVSSTVTSPSYSSARSTVTSSSVYGVTTMPTTGGGRAPGLPILPALLGLALAGLGALGRRLSLATL